MDKQDEVARSLFGEAVELPRERRSAFLDGACAGKPDLRRVVEDLLNNSDRLSGFLSEPVYVEGRPTGRGRHGPSCWRRVCVWWNGT